MVTLLLGRAGTGKTSKIVDEFASCMQQGMGHLYYIIPEQYSHDAERLLLKVCGDKLSLHGEVLSFSRLANRVFSEVGGLCATLLDNGGRILMMSRALDAVGEKLSVFNRSEQKADYLENLVAVIKELKSACMTPGVLETAAVDAPSPLNDKLRDLALVMAAYDSFFDHETADPDDRLNRLAESICDSTLFEGGRIWIDGFTDYTAQELSVIQELMRYCPNLTVCLTCDGIDGSEEVFEASRKTANLLVKMAQDIGVPIRIEQVEGASKLKSSELIFLEKYLFSHDDVKYSQTNNAIAIIEAASPGEECEAAAAKVLELAREGYRWRDIAVSFTDADTYAVLAENTFEKYNIPVFVSKKSDIGQKPPVALIESALDIIVNGWDCTSVFKYIKTGMTGLSLADCDILENYALLWNLRGAIWTRDADWTQSPSGFQQDHTDGDQALLSRINKIKKRVVAPVIKLQRSLARMSAFDGKLRALYQFLLDINLPELIINKAIALSEEGNVQLSDEYKQLWDILVRVLDQFYSIAGTLQGSNGVFARCWKLLISQYDVGSIPVALDRVGLGDIRRQRRRDVKVLIVIGGTDDKLPSLSDAGGVLSDSERRTLITLGVRLGGTSEERLYRELNAIYTALTLPSEKLIMLYPSTGLGGGEKRKSYILRKMSSMFAINEESADVALLRLSALIPCFELAASHTLEQTSLSKIAFEYCCQYPDLAARLKTLSEVSIFNRGSLSEAGARRLYGRELSMSASRVDKFYACRYLYFLQYGLNAKPRKPAGFDAPTAGTFMHYILENVVRDIRDAGGFRDIADNDVLAITKGYVEKYVNSVLGSFRDKSNRFQYLFNRLRKDTDFIVLDMVQELRQSAFTPIDFELEFSERGAIPAHTITDGNSRLRVNGFVDRLDGWEQDGKLYLRVVDYKTGKKAFSLSDVWYGMGMQMLIYLFTLAEHGELRYGKKVVPAGILYAPAREEVLQASRYATEAELEEMRSKKHRRSGLVLDDTIVLEAMEKGSNKQYLPIKDSRDSGDSLATVEQFALLSKHIDQLLLEIAASVHGGSIDAMPYFKNKTDHACQFCDYQSACHFSEKDGDKRRYLKKIPTADAWEKMKGE